MSAIIVQADGAIYRLKNGGKDRHTVRQWAVGARARGRRGRGGRVPAWRDLPSIARTEGYNTNIKLIKRTARGFRSQANYQRRILLANAAAAA